MRRPEEEGNLSDRVVYGGLQAPKRGVGAGLTHQIVEPGLALGSRWRPGNGAGQGELELTQRRGLAFNVLVDSWMKQLARQLVEMFESEWFKEQTRSQEGLREA